jgi:CheY-like chemotaxis protein
MAIFGYTDSVLSDLDGASPLRLRIEEIRHAGERASGLTRQLLAFSRKQILDPEILDLNSVVANTERLLQRLIGENIQLKTRLASGLKAVRADFGQIEQVIVNLAVNARDAMPDGGCLTIETANVELGETYAQDHAIVRPGCYVMLAVSDTGCGMSDEVQSHIFEPFYTTKDPGKGTGLGLATAYGIVKQSGGHIWLYSELGAGTTFKIYLSPAESGARVSVPTKEPAEVPALGQTILVAEDDEIVRKLIVTVLRAKGYRVVEAANGEQALEVWTQYSGKIDLLLTDTVMPGMSGPTLSGRLKIRQPEISVLYMSGYTDNALLLHDVLESGVAFLQKPFGLDVLARKVSEVLNSR